MTKMDKEVKKQWLSALRSGEYQQTQQALRNKRGHCCLGVLCDVFAKERGDAKWRTAELSERSEGRNPYRFDAALPGAVVVMWSGLDADTKVNINGERAKLWEHNDKGRTFAEIAAAIQEQL